MEKSLIEKELENIFEKKVFIVRNPNRKTKLDQYNVRVLQIEDVLKVKSLSLQKAREELGKKSTTSIESEEGVGFTVDFQNGKIQLPENYRIVKWSDVEEILGR